MGSSGPYEADATERALTATERADTKRLVEVPDHLSVVGAPLDRVEAALPRARS